MKTLTLNHLAMGYISNDLCIAKGVKKLPPAHAGLLDMQNGDFNVALLDFT